MKRIKLFFIGLLLIFSSSSLFGTTQEVKSFVTRFYQKVLNREPDPTGLQDWTNQLLLGTKSGADIARGFIFSPEFINRNTNNSDYLTILYRAFFNREPDTIGYNDWIGKLNGGSSREFILNGFLYSPEFGILCKKYGISPVTPLGKPMVENLDIIFRGIILDDYVKNAKICIDKNRNDKCDENEDFTLSDSEGRFSFPNEYYKEIIKYPFVVEGGIDIGTNKPFKGIFSAPPASPVISIFTTIVNNLLKNGKSKKEANLILQQKLELPQDVEVTNFDPMYLLEHSNNGILKEISKKILSKQTQLETIVKMNREVISLVDNSADIKKVSKNLIKNISQKILSAPQNQKVDINSDFISKVLVDTTKEIYKEGEVVDKVKIVSTIVSLTTNELIDKAKEEIEKAPADMEAIKTSDKIILLIDNRVVPKVKESIISGDITQIVTLNINEEYNNLEVVERPSTSSENTLLATIIDKNGSNSGNNEENNITNNDDKNNNNEINNNTTTITNSLKLTSGMDNLNGTGGDDVITDRDEKDDLQNGDKIVDTSTKDSDKLIATITNDHLKPIIQNIETIKIIGEYISTGLDLDNIVGTKLLTLDTKIADGVAKVLNANFNSATSISVGSNIAQLRVSSSNRGTEGNIIVDGGNGDIKLNGSEKVDEYTLKLSKDKKVSLNSIDGGDKVTINAKGDFLLSNSNSSNLSLIINNISKNPIKIIKSDENSIAKDLTLSGNEIIFDIKSNSIFGNIENFNSTAKKSTIQLSKADNYNLNRLAVTEIRVLRDMVNYQLILNPKTEVNLIKEYGNTNLKFNNGEEGDRIYLNLETNQNSINIGDNISKTTINFKDSININRLSFGANSKEVFIEPQNGDISIKELNLEPYSNNNFKLTTLSKIELKGVIGNSIEVVAGAGNDHITTGYFNDIIDSGAGDDIIKGKGGDDEITTGDGSDIIIIGSNDGNDIIKDFKRGVDTLIVAGISTFYKVGEIDLTNLANSENPIQDPQNGEIYRFTNNNQKVILKGITATDLSNSVQLGSLKEGEPFIIKGNIKAGIKDDFIDTSNSNDNIHYDITTGEGKDAIAINSNSNITVKDFNIEKDRIVLVGNGNGGIDLKNITPNGNRYTFYPNDDKYSITLTGVTSTSAKDFVQLGYKNSFFQVSGNVVAGRFDDFIYSNGAGNIINFIDNGGFDTIKFVESKLSFDLIDGINGSSGIKPTTKVKDATDGKIYIIDNNTFSCNLDKSLQSLDYDYRGDFFKDSVAHCIDSALGTSKGEKYVAIIEGVNFDNSGQNDSLIYIVKGDDEKIKNSNIASIGIILNHTIKENEITSHSN